jgi:hypothetical protein
MTIATVEQLEAAKAMIAARRASAPPRRVHTVRRKGPTPETFVARNPPPNHYLSCPHRGDAIATTTGNIVGCGCGGTRVEFYECKQFEGEAVLKDCKAWAKKANQEKIQAACPTYKGRTCRNCELWAKVAKGN